MFCRASPVNEPVFLGQGKPRNVGSHSWFGHMIRWLIHLYSALDWQLLWPRSNALRLTLRDDTIRALVAWNSCLCHWVNFGNSSCLKSLLNRTHDIGEVATGKSKSKEKPGKLLDSLFKKTRRSNAAELHMIYSKYIKYSRNKFRMYAKTSNCRSGGKLTNNMIETFISLFNGFIFDREKWSKTRK